MMIIRVNIPPKVPPKTGPTTVECMEHQKKKLLFLPDDEVSSDDKETIWKKIVNNLS